MYADKWRRLRNWTYASWAMFIAGITVAFLLSFPSFGGADNYFVPSWFGAWVVLSWVVASFRCPRCNKPFFKPNFLAVNGFAQKCLHCGFPKWGDNHNRRTRA